MSQSSDAHPREGDRRWRDDAQAETTGKRIRAVRERRGWTQTELARRSGVGRDQVNDYEQARTVPGTTVLVALAKALEVTLDALV